MSWADFGQISVAIPQAAKMIEITAKLMRTEAGIYATGERLECLIEFQNKGPSADAEDGSSASELENLAWASMQIHCYRKTAQDLIVSAPKGGSSAGSGVGAKPLEPNQGIQTGKTSLDTVTPPLGDIIYASQPKILFCDLKLTPNQSKSCKNATNPLLRVSNECFYDNRFQMFALRCCHEMDRLRIVAMISNTSIDSS